MEFSRQEYWNRLAFCILGYCPDQSVSEFPSILKTSIFYCVIVKTYFRLFWYKWEGRGKCTPLIGREFFLININYVYVYGEGNGNPLQYSCLENPMDGGAWKATVHGVTKSWTWLSNIIFTFPFHALEKDMATHSSVLAWRIPGTGEPGGLPSTGSHRLGYDWSDLAEHVKCSQGS